MSATARPCARCGQPIPAERVEAIPETRVCVGCSRDMGGTEFDTYARAETVSKSDSLKKNYGGYSVVRVRKPIRPKGPG